jgi:hypothetical protein
MPETTTTTTSANTITIDGSAYETDKLSEAAKQHLANLHVVDLEIARLNMQLGIAHTARAAYGVALREALAKQKAG